MTKPLILLLSVFLLSACGGKSAAPEVATVQTSATAAQQTQAAEDAKGRPMISMDMAEEEINRINEAWYQCLGEHGSPMAAKGELSLPTDIVGRKPAAAYKACLPKEPTTPDSWDPKKNPQYNEDLRKWAKCMRDHGVDVKVSSSGRMEYGEKNTFTGTRKEKNKMNGNCWTKAFDE